MEKIHEVEIEIHNAKAKTNIMYNALESSLATDSKNVTFSAGELRDLLVLLSDVSGHLNVIEEKLFPETEAQAA